MDTLVRDDTVTRWYVAYAEHLYAGLTRLLPNPDDRREVVQETFVRAILRFGHYDPRREAVPWLTAIARNLAIDHLRRGYETEQSVSEEIISNYRSPEFCTVQNDLTHRIARAVTALPRRDRQIVQLYYYQELSVREVAAVLGLPVGTVKFRLYRCRQTLAAALEGTSHET